MIVRLTGTLIDVTEETVVVERDGVAREILVPRFAVGELAACMGQEVTLLTMEFLEGNQASGNLVPRMLGFLHPEDKIFFSRFPSLTISVPEWRFMASDWKMSLRLRISRFPLKLLPAMRLSWVPL